MESAQKKVLVPVACGSEEMEVVTLIDVFRVAGANVTVASVEARLQVECSNRVKLVADTFIADCAFQIFDPVALPGGMPGSERLRDCKVLQNITEAQSKDGRFCGAMSEAPAVVLETWGLLKGLRVLVPVANGSNVMETVMVVDVLRRAKADVIVASVEESLEILAARGSKIVADHFLEDICNSTYDLILLPVPCY